MNPTEGNPPAPWFASGGSKFFFHILLTLSLFLSISFVPLAGLLMGILTPLPTVLALIRFGAPSAWFVPGVSGLAGALILFWLGMEHSIPYFASMLAMGIVLGYGIRKLWVTEKVIGLSSLVVIAMAAVLVALSFVETKGELVGLLEQDLRGAISATLKQLGTPTAETRELETALLAAVPIIVRIMPGITVSCTLLIAWLNMLIARRYCRAGALGEYIMDDWRLWKAPEALVWVLIASGIALFAPGDGFRYPALNVFIVLGSIYFLQGLSISAFFLDKWKLPVFLRALIYGILVMQQIASIAIAVLGLFDMWFDFRRMATKPE
ncbi:MAG: DUF2232 domain-containing protein [Syntrophobacteraceae bacterium]